ncbi:hypothetical protein GW17_00008699, partial [Ensete ventricosum]
EEEIAEAIAIEDSVVSLPHRPSNLQENWANRIHVAPSSAAGLPLTPRLTDGSVELVSCQWDEGQGVRVRGTVVEMVQQQLHSLSLDLSSGTATESELPATPSVVYMDVNVVPEHDKEGLASAISSLQGSNLSGSVSAVEMSELRSKQRYLDAKRREALDKILDIKGSIRVFCRVKLMDERTAASRISTEADKITVRSAGTRKEFVLDRVFHPESTQGDRPNVLLFFSGRNLRMEVNDQFLDSYCRGCLPRSHSDPEICARWPQPCLKSTWEASETCSSTGDHQLESRNGFLNGKPSLSSTPIIILLITSVCLGSNLSILRSGDGTVEIEGLTDVQVADVKQARRWYARGKHARSTSWTNVNDASSRSHWNSKLTQLLSDSLGAEPATEFRATMANSDKDLLVVLSLLLWSS